MKRNLAIIATALIPLLLSIPPAHATTISTVYYTSGDGTTQVGMDIYTPGTAPLGAVIAVHGGGWHLGNKSKMTGSCNHFAADGFLCFAPNYRLAPAHPYPAAVLDLEQALVWIQAHYGYGPNQIGAFGGSAGGNLVAMLDTMGLVKVAATWSGPIDLTTILAQGCKCVTQVNSYAPTDRDKRDASPVFRVDFTDGPMLVANSTAELIPVQQAYEMRDALVAAGVPYKLDVIYGTAHGLTLWSKEWPSTRAWLEPQL